MQRRSNYHERRNLFAAFAARPLDACEAAEKTRKQLIKEKDFPVPFIRRFSDFGSEHNCTKLAARPDVSFSKKENRLLISIVEIAAGASLNCAVMETSTVGNAQLNAAVSECAALD